MDLVTTIPLAALALALEAGLGYPPGLFAAIGHPVTWIGRLIAASEAWLNRPHWSFAARRISGFIALGTILSIALAVSVLLVQALDMLPAPASLAAMALLASSLIAQRSLYTHVHEVAEALGTAGLESARTAVAKIVGRDVGRLDEKGVSRAAIESLAENFSDAIVAPVLFLALFGLPGAVLYKTINTADSMIGHKSERFCAFGFASARLDDLVNLVPARLSALLIAIAAFFVPGASPRGAFAIALRDSRGHASPNAGWPEAAFAGALGVKLGGPRSYAGQEVEDCCIGEGREAIARDIFRALALYRAACLAQVFLLALLSCFFIWQG
jgi:adenosylcobinamide-phosphate synthase